ncbi:Spermine oxidase [Araneus ventricosus]|uniref:Spermine oxidase n=1 Tax=Araneus ventricosus TaxID=182803 RepID=A0A4Y2E7R8_ARAVE|nr:Spermine oxidase [Araneus ventricosus]
MQGPQCLMQSLHRSFNVDPGAKMTELNACCSADDKVGILDKQIIIIGAGISGIACGCHLKELGFQNVRILEARNRVGGRIYGIDVGSKYIELGAQWIHGETDNSIYEIAESNGLVNKKTYNYLDAIRNFSNFSSEERKVLSMLFDFLEDKVNNYSNDDECSSLLNYLDEQFKNFLSQCGPCNFPDRLNEGFEWYCKFLNEVNGCHDLATLSLKLLNTYKECEGNPTVEVKDGFSTLLSVFVEMMPPDWILKNKIVTKVDWSDFKESNDECKISVSNSTKNSRNIKVTCNDEETFLADHVVITLPLGCLKKLSQSLFVPNLSETKKRAIRCLGFGAINKVYLEFKEVFWEPNAVYNILWEKEFDGLLGQNSHKLNTHWLKYIDRIAYTPNHPNLLCVWVTGDGAVQMESLSEEEVSDNCMKLLQLLLKVELPKPSRFFRSSWMLDPFSCGSYSYLSVDCEKENVFPHDLAEPEYASSPFSKHPVLLFAGEATHDQYYSTVHGAYETGLREAERIFHHYRLTLGYYSQALTSWLLAFDLGQMSAFAERESAKWETSFREIIGL